MDGKLSKTGDQIWDFVKFIIILFIIIHSVAIFKKTLKTLCTHSMLNQSFMSNLTNILLILCLTKCWCWGWWQGGLQPILRVQVRWVLLWRPAGNAAASSCLFSSLWRACSETRSSPEMHKTQMIRNSKWRNNGSDSTSSYVHRLLMSILLKCHVAPNH